MAADAALLLGCNRLLTGLDINAQTQTGYSAFFYAASYGRIDVLKAHLAVPELDINIVDTNGASALIRAIRDYRTKVVEILLSQPGIDVNIQEQKWPWGTALINAAMKATHPEHSKRSISSQMTCNQNVN